MQTFPFYYSVFLTATMLYVATCSTTIYAQDRNDWTDSVSLSGFVEFETFSMDGSNGNESNLDLATVDLDFNANLSDSVSAYAVLLAEAPDHNIKLDAGGLALGFSAVSLNLGKQYLPFGSFESHMISDSLTLEIGETNESAAMVSFEADGASGSFYVFDGDVDEESSVSAVDNFGASLGFTSNKFEASLGYINSITDSDNLGEIFEENGINEYPAGVAVFAAGRFANLALIAEYVAATDDFIVEESSVEPSAFNIEAGYGFNVASKEASVAIAYQGTQEAQTLALPETRILLGLSLDIKQTTTLSFEYAKDTDYEPADGGDGEDTNIYTAQITVEF